MNQTEKRGHWQGSTALFTMNAAFHLQVEKVTNY